MTAKAESVVDATTLNAFEQDGAVLVRSLIGPDQIEQLRAATDAALTQSDNYFHRQRVWEHDAVCSEFCLRSPAPALAAQLLCCDKINLFYDQVFAKQADAIATPWHNDQPYWPVRGWPVMTVWLALDEIGFDAGPLEFIAGSHRWNRWFQPFLANDDGGAGADYPGDDTGFEPLPDFDAERDRHRILCWEMHPGDVIGFHALVVHGARANAGASTRRGYAVRYTGSGATYHLGSGVNPRITNDTLQPGEPLDSAQYPVAYRR